MSEKKKHHSFRVKLPAREVMRRLQTRYAFEIYNIDVTGYDLTSGSTRISLREDAASNETIVFIEDDGSSGGKILATAYERYLNEINTHLREPIMWSPHTRSLFGVSIHEQIIEAPPEAVLATLKSLKYTIGWNDAPEGDRVGMCELRYLLSDSSNNTPDITSTVYIYQGQSANQTRLVYSVYPSDKGSSGVLTSVFVLAVFMSILGIVGGVMFSDFSILFGSFVTWTVGLVLTSMYSRKRRIYRHFEQWLGETLQSIAEQTAHEATTAGDAMLDDNMPNEVRQSYKG